MAVDPWSLSDAELEAEFQKAKAENNSPDVGNIEEELEEVVDDLEQPEEESDDDASGTEDAEEDVNDDSEGDEAPGEETKELEEQPKVTGTKVEDVAQPVQRHKFKANGKDFEFTMDEMIEQFPKVFGQAMDYTRKTQAMKPWRKTIDAIENASLSHDDVNLMIDVLKGDKDAIAEVLRRTKVDNLDLDMERSAYTPKDYGRDENTLAIRDVLEDIKDDAEYVVTNRILSKDWDDKSFAEITKDPEMIRLLHMDVKSGMYSKVQPIAEKLKVYDSGKRSDLEYYADAAKMYFNDLDTERARLVAADSARIANAEKAKIAEVKANRQKAQAVQQESVKRKAAAPTKSRAGGKTTTNYLDDSDEAFEEWYKALQDK